MGHGGHLRIMPATVPTMIEQVVDASAQLPWDARSAARAARCGRHDPCTHMSRHELWWAVRSPDGPATLRLRWAPSVDAEAWGEGHEWALARVPGLLGALDDPSALVTDHPLVREWQQRSPHHRIGRTGDLLGAGVQTILGQRVTTIEARNSWAHIVRVHGSRAPGPQPLVLPPSAEHLAGLPSWAYHRFGVERKRADAIRRYCRELPRLERERHDDAQFNRRLRSVLGIGIWTEAEIRYIAFGDPDALIVGDYHAKNVVAHAFTGAWKGTDEQMVETLEPFRGQRRRVLALIGAAGIFPERRAPHQRINPIARW
jgi:3-methyladenine DNA glycosylase/8-oxoguanine DNA glycosylase